MLRVEIQGQYRESRMHAGQKHQLSSNQLRRTLRCIEALETSLSTAGAGSYDGFVGAPPQRAITRLDIVMFGSLSWIQSNVRILNY